MRVFAKCLLIFLVAAAFPAAVSAQFYNDYSREERIRLSREYYALGTYLVGLGRIQGAWYLNVAYGLDPDLMQYFPDKQTNKDEDDLLKFRFTRMASALIVGDLARFYSYFDEGFYSGAENRRYRHWEWMDRIDGAMEKTDTSGISPYFLFDLDHINIRRYAGYSILEVRSKLHDFPEFAPIFPENQYYVLRLSGGKWLISGLFTEAPSEKRLKEFKAESDDIEIKDFFLSSVRLFAARDLNALLLNFYDSVYLLPMKNKITKPELELTLKGLFNEEETPQTGMTPDYEAIRKCLSLEVLPARPDFLDETGINGRFILITVNNPENKAILPAFWSSYKKYYVFSQNERYQFFAFE
jgi:hypothetical protein